MANSDYINKLYETYAKQREKLHSSSLETGARFDRMSLTLGGGTLVLSLAFLEKISPNPAPWTLLVLIISWICLIVSVLFQLVAMKYSLKAIEWQIELLDAEYSSYFGASDIYKAMEEWKAKQEDLGKDYVQKTKRISHISTITLIVGIIFMCVFVSVNVYFKQEGEHGQRKTETHREAEGANKRDIYSTEEPSSTAAATGEEKLSTIQEIDEVQNGKKP